MKGDETPEMTHLTFLVPEGEQSAVTASGVAKSLRIDTLKMGLEDLEGQIQELLRIIPSQPGGYQLASVQISLGVDVSGGVFFVTAGVQASLTLSYTPRDAN